MKKQILTAIALAGLSFAAMAQKFFEPVTFTGAFPVQGTAYTAKIEGTSDEFTFPSGNWTTGWTEFYPNTVDYPAPDANNILQGDVSTDKSISGNVELKGTVHVTNGATLTIAAGTKIRAGLGATLIISKGSKINAVGTQSNPIVFTSIKGIGQRNPGDWAGILLIGNSQVNTANGTRQYEALPNDAYALYGGGKGANLNLADNSGEMRFVRIEFAGYNYLPDQELNGLTLGAVGSGTRVNFIQVSYARDDSFEWFGGTSKHKYLVALGGVDDDFDMDEGYAGQVQFILGVRNPAVFETAAGGTSNGFEHDNNTGIGSSAAVVPGNNNPTPNTKPLISNATLIGPWINGTPTSGNKFGRGLEMRSAVSTSIYNSLVIGYNTGVQLVHPSATITPSVQERLRVGDAEYTNVHFILNNTGTGAAFTSSSNPPSGEFNTAAFNTYLTGRGTNFLHNPANTIFQTVITSFGSGSNTGTASPSYMIATASPTAGVAAVFTGVIAPFVGDVTLNPSLLVDKNTIAFPTRLQSASSTAVTVNIAASNLTASGITIASSNSNFVLSTTNVTATSGSFTVNFVTTVGGVSTGQITVSGQGLSQIINVSGTVVAPAEPFVNADIASIEFTSAENAAPFTSTSKSFMVSGRELTSAVTVSGTADFTVSTDNATFGSSVILTPSATGLLLSTVYVKLNSSNAARISSNINIESSGAMSKMVSVKANLAPALEFEQSGNITATPGLTIDYATGQSISTTSQNMIVRGKKLPTTGVTVSVLSGSLEISSTSTFTPGTTSIILPVTAGVITATSSNLFVRFIPGSIPSNPHRGVQVGVISVSGFDQVIAVNIRENSPTASGAKPALPTSNGYILADASSNVLTALGFAPNAVLRSTPWIYSATNNAAIGRVSALSATAITLSGNSLITTNTPNTAVTITGTASTDANSLVITGTGTNWLSEIPVGLPLHYADGTLIGYAANVDVSFITVNTVPGSVISTTSAVVLRTSAIKIKRAPATISVGLTPSPIAFNITSILGSNSVVPVLRVITLTGDNHEGDVTVRINPALLNSGKMFEINPGTVDAASFIGGIFSTTVGVNANGQLNATVTIRYNPNNIVSLSLPGLNVLSAHSTELEIRRAYNPSAPTSGADDPRGTLAINLRGNAQPGPVSSSTPIIGSANGDVLTDLAPFTSYKGVVSSIQTFRVRFTRIFNDVSIVSPANFYVRESGTTSWVSSLTLTPAGGSVDKTIEVGYLSAVAGSHSGAIQISTPSVAAFNVNVTGNSIDFASFINIATPTSSDVLSLTGTSMVTVNGQFLTSPLTLTGSNGFLISLTESAFAESVVLTPDPADFGDLAFTTVYVSVGTTTGSTIGTLTATSASATSTISLVNSNILSVADEIKSSSFVVYPNPSKGNVTIAYEGVDATVRVYDFTGNTVFATSLTSGISNTEINGLGSGLYIVSIISKEGKKTAKLVVE